MLSAIVPELGFMSEHRASLGRDFGSTRPEGWRIGPLKTPKPVPRRPAWCHPERGPGWLGPKAFPDPPSQAQATEEALMRARSPEATAAGAAWASLGLGGGAGPCSSRASVRPQAQV